MAIEPTKTITFNFETVNGATLKIESRFLSSRQSAEHRRIVKTMIDQTYDAPETIDAANAALTLAIVDWTPGKLDDVLTTRELVTLAVSYPSAVYAAEATIAAEMGPRIIYPKKDGE